MMVKRDNDQTKSLHIGIKEVHQPMQNNGVFLQSIFTKDPGD